MCTYYQIHLRVAINSRSDMYIKCRTLKFSVHIANFVWSTHFQRDILYTYNKVGLRLLQLNACARTLNSTNTKLVPPLGTHHVEHSGMH